jgi:hypothetical protein
MARAAERWGKIARLVNAFANWIHQTNLGWAAGGGVRWVEPAAKTFHFAGLVLLFGCAGIYDLRLLGVARALPVAPLQRLMPYAVLGFVINLATGIVLFAGNPFQYVSNVTFGLKMLFIALAGLNAMVFYAAGVARRVEPIAAGESAPLAAKMIAATSLFLWIGVMYWGRMLPFVGNAF